jgi:hypothetical protein
VIHTLFFFGGQAGAVPQQEGENPHKKYVEKFTNDSLARSAGIDEGSGIVETTFSPILAQNSFFNKITGWLTSPYSTINATGLPPMFKLLLNALMGFFEAYTVYKAVRGGF